MNPRAALAAGREWLVELAGLAAALAQLSPQTSALVEQYGPKALALLALVELRGVRRAVHGLDARVSKLETKGKHDASRSERKVSRGRRSAR